MTSLLRLAALLPLATLVASADIERTLEKTYPVAPGDRVSVDLPHGPISVDVSPGDTVRLELRQRIDAATDAEADRILADYHLETSATAGTVKLHVRAPRSGGWFGGWRQKVKFSAHLTVPADVDLRLDTAGGAISVDGLVSGDLHADTSGGAIQVSGGTGDINLDTSGGSIRVAQALGSLRADTSGGSISIGYVGPAATAINADTSGGSITIGVDPAGHWDLQADTSGGGVQVKGLTLANATLGRSSARGRLNAGGQPLRADTSGGSITLRATPAP